MFRLLRQLALAIFLMVTLLFGLGACARKPTAPATPTKPVTVQATPTKVPATPTPTKVPATATPTKVPATPTPTKAPAPATVKVGDNKALGKFLVAANGMTLYTFKKDAPGKSTCIGDCAKKWPPLLIKEGEKPVAGEGITGKLDVIKRSDGGYQVTYSGMPLYFFADDKAPGDAKGQGVNNDWFVAKA